MRAMNLTIGNKVAGWLIWSDFLLQSGWGLIGPIFAIFIEKHIHGGLPVIGFIAASFWITKSFLQPFLAEYFDSVRGERDDFRFLIGGMLVANLVPLGYIFSTQIWQLFMLEVVRGIAMACVIPSWYAIFTRHITKGREAFEWSLDSTAIGLSAGLAAMFGGIIGAAFGFSTLFVLVTMFGLSATYAMWHIRSSLQEI